MYARDIKINKPDLPSDVERALIIFYGVGMHSPGDYTVRIVISSITPEDADYTLNRVKEELREKGYF